MNQQAKAFQNQNKHNLIEASIPDSRPNGLVESLTQTIKSCLVCFQTVAENQLKIMTSSKSIIYKLIIYRRQNFNLSPPGAHFGSKTKSSLMIITIDPEPNTLTKKALNKNWSQKLSVGTNSDDGQLGRRVTEQN